MMRCPLPVDWLEYLEGTRSPELTAHLAKCLPCQISVQELQREPRPVLRSSWAGHAWPHWRAAGMDGDDGTAPMAGDLRLLADVAGIGMNIPVVLISDSRSEGAQSWFEVAPVLTDIESATALDLMLFRNDTSLQTPLRVVFRRQAVVDSSDLRVRIGSLTESGRLIIDQAMQGKAPSERFGTPVVDDNVHVPHEIDNIVESLNRKYGLLVEENDTEARPAEVISFKLHPVMFSQPSSDLRLAAATSAREDELQWEADDPRHGRFRGRVEYRHAADELILVIEEFVAAEPAARLRAQMLVQSTRLSEPAISEPFVPLPGTSVVIGRDLGVLPAEIAGLELRVAHEH